MCEYDTYFYDRPWLHHSRSAFSTNVLVLRKDLIFKCYRLYCPDLDTLLRHTTQPLSVSKTSPYDLKVTEWRLNGRRDSVVLMGSPEIIHLSIRVK